VRRAAAALCLAALALPACGNGAPPPGETVRFTTEDGVELAGEIRGSGEVGVVLAHMFPADRTSWAEFAQALADRGYTTLAFDFRGYGDSGGTKDIPELWRDVEAAVAEVRARGVRQVAVIGASMGGTAALIAASRQDLGAVITLSAATTFMGLQAPDEVLGAIDEPKLFIAAEGDSAAAATAQTLFTSTPGAKRIEIVTGSDHGTDLLDGSQGEVVRNLVVSFLDTRVLAGD
jgi:pimeloyl-ACP methyl ester carboxylesterase